MEDATTVGRLSNRHILPRGEIMKAIKDISPIGTLCDSHGDRIYPLADCQAALTKILIGKPKGIQLKSLENVLKLSRVDSLATLRSLGLSNVDLGAPIPHTTFMYFLQDLQKHGKVSSEIVSVVELAMRYGVTEIHIVSVLSSAFVPLVLRARQLAYRFYDRPSAERVLAAKLSPAKSESLRAGGYRTYGMLLVEFHITRAELSAVVIGMYPEKRWVTNCRMARGYYEAIKQELIKRHYKQRK